MRYYKVPSNQGDGDPASADVIFSLACQAAKIEQDREDPVVQIQTEKQ